MRSWKRRYFEALRKDGDLFLYYYEDADCRSCKGWYKIEADTHMIDEKEQRFTITNVLSANVLGKTNVKLTADTPEEKSMWMRTILSKFFVDTRGWMWKEGYHIKQWRRRYFEALKKDTDWYLYYYEDQGCRTFKGWFKLSTDTMIVNMSDVMFILKSIESAHNPGRRDVKFRAESSFEKDRWTSAITSAIQGKMDGSNVAPLHDSALPDEVEMWGVEGCMDGSSQSDLHTPSSGASSSADFLMVALQTSGHVAYIDGFIPNFDDIGAADDAASVLSDTSCLVQEATLALRHATQYTTIACNALLCVTRVASTEYSAMWSLGEKPGVVAAILSILTLLSADATVTAAALKALRSLLCWRDDRATQHTAVFDSMRSHGGHRLVLSAIGTHIDASDDCAVHGAAVLSFLVAHEDLVDDHFAIEASAVALTVVQSCGNNRVAARFGIDSIAVLCGCSVSSVHRYKNIISYLLEHGVCTAIVAVVAAYDTDELLGFAALQAMYALSIEPAAGVALGSAGACLTIVNCMNNMAYDEHVRIS